MKVIHLCLRQIADDTLILHRLEMLGLSPVDSFDMCSNVFSVHNVR